MHMDCICTCTLTLCIYALYMHVGTYVCRTQQELREGKGREGLEEIDSSNFDS